MEYFVLASGSKGNSTLIRSGDTTILLDCGCTKSYYREQFAKIGIDNADLSAVVITHSHSDHLKGVGCFGGVPMYAPFEIRGRHDERPVAPYAEFRIGGIRILPIKLSHDAPETVGYIFYGDEELVYVTDTGYLSERNLGLIHNAEYYIFEANHDVEMLMDTDRPIYLKARILSDVGHLSNAKAANYLSGAVGTATKEIVLAHISQEANTTQLAYDSVTAQMRDNGIAIDHILIRAAEQFGLIRGGRA